MDKHAKRSSLLHYPVLIVFTLFFVGLFALDLITPDRAYSELENTTLSQRPALTQLSAKGLNSYFTAYTKYVKDQVFGRDQWISLQSMVETTLLQKEQNGGILLGREHMMFPRTFGLLSSEERTPAQEYFCGGIPLPAVPRQGECTAGPGCIGHLPGERTCQRAPAGREHVS